MFTPQELGMYLVLGTLFGGIKAMFNQQQNMLVSPVFVSLIRSHIVHLFTGMTTNHTYGYVTQLKEHKNLSKYPMTTCVNNES